MRIETKVLIVLIVMILSVGPLEYFFGSQPKELEVPENNTQEPTTHTLAANITGKVVELQPYISYVGIASFNSPEAVNATLAPLGLNYTLDVSLNSRGEGYQYAIMVRVNDTSLLKETGFRLIYHLSQLFDPSKSLPLVIGKFRVPQNFTVGNVTITSKENLTVQAIFLYSEQENDSATVACSSIVTSANYKLAKLGSTCYDVELSQYQPYFGLSEYDVMLSAEKESTFVNVNVTSLANIATYEGSFGYADRMTNAELESYINSSLNLTSVKAEVQLPGDVITLYGVNASLINITNATAYQSSPNTTEVFFAGTLNDTLERLRQQLGYLPQYELPRGTYTLTFGYTDENVFPMVAFFLAQRGLTIEKRYKAGDVVLPDHVIVGDTTYYLFRVSALPAKLKLDTPEGKVVTIELRLTVKYSEIIDAEAEEDGLFPKS